MSRLRLDPAMPPRNCSRFCGNARCYRQCAHLQPEQLGPPDAFDRFADWLASYPWRRSLQVAVFEPVLSPWIILWLLLGVKASAAFDAPRLIWGIVLIGLFTQRAWRPR